MFCNEHTLERRPTTSLEWKLPSFILSFRSFILSSSFANFYPLELQVHAQILHVSRCLQKAKPETRVFMYVIYTWKLSQGTIFRELKEGKRKEGNQIQTCPMDLATTVNNWDAQTKRLHLGAS